MTRLNRRAVEVLIGDVIAANYGGEVDHDTFRLDYIEENRDGTYEVGGDFFLPAGGASFMDVDMHQFFIDDANMVDNVGSEMAEAIRQNGWKADVGMSNVLIESDERHIPFTIDMRERLILFDPGDAAKRFSIIGSEGMIDVTAGDLEPVTLDWGNELAEVTLHELNRRAEGYMIEHGTGIGRISQPFEPYDIEEED